MKIEIPLTLIMVILTLNCYGQEKILYHKCEFTDPGSFITVKWNISADTLPDVYTKETVDTKGRVIELQFFKNNSLNYLRECGVNPWIKFEYPNDTTIIEYRLDWKGEKECNIECFIPYKTKYYLSKDQRKILKAENEYYIDTTLYSKEDIKEFKENMKLQDSTFSNDEIDYFDNSIAKLNGKYPVSKDFDIEFSDIMGDAERDEVLKALNNK